MNADLQKLRDSRLFHRLPDRAFDRILKYVKVRAFSAAEKVADIKESGEFAKSFGYVVRGRVLFVGENDKPLGLAIKDEFFLGRNFSIKDIPVSQLVSGHQNTLIVWIPKTIIEILANNSEMFAEIMEDIYDSIFERAELMASDIKGKRHYQEWIRSDHAEKTLSNWLGELEKRRAKAVEKIRKERRQKLKINMIWGLGILAVLAAALESFGRMFQLPISFSYHIFHELRPYNPGTDWNIFLGIVGYTLLIFTALHGFNKWALKKFKWKFNYKFSSQVHIVFGVIGLAFIVLHTAFHFTGMNVAQIALYTMWVGALSGIVGQVISNQIPKTIRGDKVKLDGLKKEQSKLKKKAELLMDDMQYKTSVAMIAPQASRGFWGMIIIDFPSLFFRSWKVKRALKNLGLGADSSSLASDLIRKEFQLRQRIKWLELANVFFKRWMLIHKPMGYLVYFLGFIHIILTMVLA